MWMRWMLAGTAVATVFMASTGAISMQSSRTAGSSPRVEGDPVRILWGPRNTGWILSETGQALIYQTPDGGRCWRKVATIPGPGLGEFRTGQPA